MHEDLNKYMLSKASIKLIRSLQQKKYRDKTDLFVVEGIKGIQEFINQSYPIQAIYTTGHNFSGFSGKIISISEEQLKLISGLTTPQKALAVCKKKKEKSVSTIEYAFILDNLRDPGNLGTLIRLADWFGMKQIIGSKNTVDCYNPKVVQASMGSLSRIDIIYVDLIEFLNKYTDPIMGTFMEGKSIYKTTLPDKGLIVLGNEANGISSEVEKLCTQKISIPQFGEKPSTESLNVAIAAAIITGELYSTKK